MNSQLENAIQEAMAELDRMSEEQKKEQIGKARLPMLSSLSEPTGKHPKVVSSKISDSALEETSEPMPEQTAQLTAEPTPSVRSSRAAAASLPTTSTRPRRSGR